MTQHVEVRSLNENDLEIISAAFKNIGWGKPVTTFQRYVAEQAAGTRFCLVATANSEFAGYVTVNWHPSYPPFAEQQIPEIQDLNVIPRFQKQGIGTRLLDQAEEEAARRSNVVGIGVGLHPGYNAAQRLYVKRGYIPDGRGLTYRNRPVEEGMQVVLDDDLILHLTRTIPKR